MRFTESRDRKRLDIAASREILMVVTPFSFTALVLRLYLLMPCLLTQNI
jgi:hypothetical protein